MDKLRNIFGSRLKTDEPLSKHTTVQIGGPAQFFLEVKSPDELIRAVKLAKANKLNYLVIGGGSNLLVADDRFPGLIIKNSLSGISLQGETLEVQSGTPLQLLVNFSLQNGLDGAQNLTGIPGTVGGAIYGNAGAYGQTISDCLIKVVCLNPKSGKTVVLNKKQCGFTYRSSIFKANGYIILNTLLRFEKSPVRQLKKQSTKILTQRLLRYPPGLKCPGSFFKNIPVAGLPLKSKQLIPPEKILYGKVPAGFLLEDTGARGRHIGGIHVSPIHGNLFINSGEGSAAQFWQLAKSCWGKVKDKFDISLEPEVQLVNLPPLAG